MPPIVDVPHAAADRPSWLRVGVIAIVGFAIGIAWPKLAGVRLGPNAPEVGTAAAEVAPMMSVVTAVAPTHPAASTSSAAAPPPQLTIVTTGGHILSCKNEAGDSLKGKDCGGLPGLDPIISARMRKLAGWPSAQDNNAGKLNIVLSLDFKTNRVVYTDVNKSSTVRDPEAFKAFFASELKNVSLKAIGHDQEKYAVAYTVTITQGAPPTATTTSTPGTTTTAVTPGTPTPQQDDGSASVEWDVAIVRDAPHTGEVVARLPRGTKVQLGTLQAGWYKVKFGPSFAKEGWVYRGAVGK